MEFFDSHIKQIRGLLESRKARGAAAEYVHEGPTDWPASNRRSLVLAADTAVELGHPRDASTSFLMWTNNPAALMDQRITILGRDLPEIGSQRASFGRIVLAGGTDFDADNSFERFREMTLLRFDVDLSGYMMRGVSQHQREWSRVGRDALKAGFSFKVLGGAMLDQLADLPYVDAAEVIFITQSRETVLEAKAIGDEVMKITGAMQKMSETLDFDCKTCDYNDVCSNVAELRTLRKAFASRKAGAAHA